MFETYVLCSTGPDAFTAAIRYYIKNRISDTNTGHENGLRLDTNNGLRAEKAGKNGLQTNNNNIIKASDTSKLNYRYADKDFINTNLYIKNKNVKNKDVSHHWLREVKKSKKFIVYDTDINS